MDYLCFSEYTDIDCLDCVNTRLPQEAPIYKKNSDTVLSTATFNQARRFILVDCMMQWIIIKRDADPLQRSSYSLQIRRQ